MAGVVCATTDQRVTQLGGDACKTNITCDAALAICTYETLDKDHDGHPPIVCSGDDSDGDRFPGHPETCDGKDNDCDGAVDVGATCPGLGTCQSGACACPPASTCGGACVDKQTDQNNCGACANACPSAATCVGGQCKCAANATACGGQCVDVKIDPKNCNGCGNACAPGYACQSGACTCPGTSWGGACVDTTTDAAHCGNCATQCPSGATCQASQCKCGPGLTACGGACVDTKSDPGNCGACGTSCTACQNGNCITCPVADLFFEQDLSGSMSTAFGAVARWDAARVAINAFATDPLSAGLGLGIGYFPIVLPQPTCVVNTDCGVNGICFSGICLAGTTGGDSCTAADYAVPGVPIAPLPGNAAAIQISMASQAANGGTPMVPAVSGALSYAKSWAMAHPTHKVAVVLLTDGLPNECTTADVTTDVANVATSFRIGTPSITTYVLGIGPDITPPQWNQIAAAGGTGTAHVALTPAALQTSLSAIRAAFKTCP